MQPLFQSAAFQYTSIEFIGAILSPRVSCVTDCSFSVTTCSTYPAVSMRWAWSGGSWCFVSFSAGSSSFCHSLKASPSPERYQSQCHHLHVPSVHIHCLLVYWNHFAAFIPRYQIICSTLYLDGVLRLVQYREPRTTGQKDWWVYDKDRFKPINIDIYKSASYQLCVVSQESQSSRGAEGLMD